MTSNLVSTTSILRAGTDADNRRKLLRLEQTREFVEGLFGEDEHALRVLSLANGVAGVLNAATVSIHAIGQAYAKLAHTTPKSGTKQVDRLLSNPGIVLDHLLPSWIEFVLSARSEAVIALDWTEFDDDDHSTLCAYLVTTHGRATPLAWRTAKKSELRGRRTRIEQDFLAQIHEWIPERVGITLLADRGFGDQALYTLLEAWGWDYVIRFRGCIMVTTSGGECRTASEWVPATGRATMLRNVSVTNDQNPIPAVVVTHDRRMKEPWCLATSLGKWSASDVVKLYGKRFTIEATFRDVKDLHFGMGLRATHIRDASRRDRLLLLVAVAHALLTLLGAASEETGLDRYLKVNTVKRRTHSLFRQGSYWYDCIPTMREEWLRPLMGAFDRIVRDHATLCACFGLI
ncbi:MAG: IS4 family transposase [Polyangiaceae bacterium]